MLALLVAACPAILTAIEPKPEPEGFHYTYNFQPGGKLTVENFNGSIEIGGWDQNTIDVTGTKHAKTPELLKELKIEVNVSGDTVNVRTTGRGGANLIIKVPRRTELVRIVSSNGGIRVNDTEGGAVLLTSNGGVRAVNLKGKLDIRTSNGGVQVNDCDGPVVLHTSNGGIKAERVRGAVEAMTSNGSLDLKMEAAAQVRAATSNGAITLRLPVSISAKVRAVVSAHGAIATDFDVRKEGENSKTRLEGAIGSGGPLLDLTTSNGTIRLNKL
jgi:DUF4097 and DUF4098 domain-containing protein YvlB